MATLAAALVLAREQLRAGRLVVAEEICRRIVAADSEQADAWLLLAVILHRQRRIAEAIPCFRRAAQLRPDSAEAHYNLGTSCLLENDVEQAVASLARAQELRPDDPQVLANLGNAYRARGDLEQAVDWYRRAAALQPDNVVAQNNLGLVLADLGRGDAAIDCFRRLLAQTPGLADTHYNLANVLRGQGQAEPAIEAYRRAIELQPASVEAHYNLGNLFREQGCPDEAIACYQRALRLQPDAVRIRDNLLSALHYRPGTTLAELAAAHAEYERRHAVGPWSPGQPAAADVTGPLRLGFVSADWGRHPVGRFLIRTLENLDRRQCQIVCYNDRLQTDEFTDRFRAASAEWHDVAALGDDELARRIREDRIQILFDLAGHTAQNRLLTFARRPAPIQITWIGYEGSTGLSAIDYLLADRHLVPPDAERYYSERVLRLPDSYVCYEPPAEAPPVSPLPALGSGRVTFGSFNNPAKITAAVVAAWAEILQRVPGSRLLLKYRGLDNRAWQSRLRRQFAERGLAAERIELAGWAPYGEYLAAYGQVDVALDPFPFNGGVTTCDALWMGVPVVTWPGEIFASRRSLSHLSAVGLEETIAKDRNDYVGIAAGLAGNLPRLAQVRAALRTRVAGSPLCNGRLLAENLLNLLRPLPAAHGRANL